jgi:hypothetical protein
MAFAPEEFGLYTGARAGAIAAASRTQTGNNCPIQKCLLSQNLEVKPWPFGKNSNQADFAP